MAEAGGHIGPTRAIEAANRAAIQFRLCFRNEFLIGHVACAGMMISNVGSIGFVNI